MPRVSEHWSSDTSTAQPCLMLTQTLRVWFPPVCTTLTTPTNFLLSPALRTKGRWLDFVPLWLPAFHSPSTSLNNTCRIWSAEGHTLKFSAPGSSSRNTDGKQPPDVQNSWIPTCWGLWPFTLGPEREQNNFESLQNVACWVFLI